MKINLIGIQLTKKCNAECDICCFSCSPRNTEKINLEIAKKFIEEASQVNTINTVGFSGGEPFLYLDELVELIKYSKNFNLRTTCTTNGFWGKSEEEALKTLRYLKDVGLNKISLSADQYHNAFVPIENIKNILNAGKELDLSVDVGCIVTKNSKRLSHIANELGDSILNTFIMEAPCLPIGNACEKIDKSEFIYLKSIPTASCKMLNSLIVMCDGSVYPCCSQGSESKPLLLGNINTDSVDTLIKNLNKNMYCRMLYTHGVKWFIDVLKSENINFFENDKYVGSCDICNTLLNNNDYIHIFDKYLEKEKSQLYKKFIEKMAMKA